MFLRFRGHLVGCSYRSGGGHWGCAMCHGRTAWKQPQYHRRAKYLGHL
jgi:hypothetical protein